MLQKIKLIALLIFCTYFFLNAQNEPPTITTCGDQHICLEDSTYTLCVAITVDPTFSGTIDSFLIEWGDNESIVIPGTNMPANQYHTYQLHQFFGSCVFEVFRYL